MEHRLAPVQQFLTFRYDAIGGGCVPRSRGQAAVAAASGAFKLLLSATVAGQAVRVAASDSGRVAAPDSGRVAASDSDSLDRDSDSASPGLYKET